MKKIILILMFSSLSLYSQIDVTAGMGVSFVNQPSFTDYINYYFAPGDDQLPSFGSTVEFFGEIGYDINKKYQVGVEYAHQIYSYNVTSYKAGFYDVSYTQLKPTVMAYYLIPGPGYKLKLGGGVGPRFVNMEEQKANSVTKQEFSATGFGIVLKAMGHTLLGDNLYATIGADLRYDMPGELSDDNDTTINNISLNENVNVNSISIGVKLGVSYFF
ncbi:MAG: hypothetical protein SCALA702_29600 [Melioribacteraceae bacterium]|nr:MAG: hypothetical protein SCALA702_29600 [Melioribacteraceae bacterium]